MSEMILCGDGIARSVDQLRNAKSHREAYPEQYTHPLCGQHVNIVGNDGQIVASGTVERVVHSQFGPLAKLDTETDRFWRVADCTPTT